VAACLCSLVLMMILQLMVLLRWICGWCNYIGLGKSGGVVVKGVVVGETDVVGVWQLLWHGDVL